MGKGLSVCSSRDTSLTLCLLEQKRRRIVLSKHNLDRLQSTFSQHRFDFKICRHRRWFMLLMEAVSVFVTHACVCFHSAPNDKKSFCSIEGEWNGVMYAKWASGVSLTSGHSRRL